MDRNTLSGLLLIGLVLLGFTWYNSKQAEEYNREKAVRDSIAMVNERLTAQPGLTPERFEDGIIEAYDEEGNPLVSSQDSTMMRHLGRELYGATQGEETTYVVENEVMKVTFSNRGGKVSGVQLKNYERYWGGPVELYVPGSAEFDLSFFIMQDYNNAEIHTGEYFFDYSGPGTTVVPEGGETVVTMRLPVRQGAYLQYTYTIRSKEYMVDFRMDFVNMGGILSGNQSDFVVNWGSIARQNEKGFENENNFSSIYYRYPGDKAPEDLGISKATKEKNENNRVQWIAFKQQFFSSIFIAENNFANASMRFDTFEPDGENIKKFSASASIPFNRQATEYNFRFYFGPNEYTVLNKYDYNLQRLVPLGWGIFGWVNRYFVIPVFNWLGKYIGNFGIIILILTILIKIIILPLTYKSYLSQAKMRLLKPEMEELNAKYPKQEDAMKRQQATMELYKKAGVSPMGGCLPLLIQMPILIAMFRFFPASIELRGEAFLWADDLSSYDSILNLPFKLPFYGDHISLFTLLMAVMMYVSSRINMAQQAAAPQMAGMKFMMLYIMPLMMLLWFNNYASGLTWYYSLSTFITIGQTYGFRYIVNDEKLHAKMKENAKKPKKKSKFQQRYEEMLKAQQQQAAQQKKGKKK